MEDLNKTQLIMLALLVSFVTSIATGITTVTLMEQAPPGVTQTITRVVKETVRIIVPDEREPETITQIIVVKQEDFVVEAVQKNSPNMVRVGYIKRKGFGFMVDDKQEIEFAGTGFVISQEGLIVLPENLLDDSREFIAESLADQTLFTISILERDADNGIVLAQLKAFPQITEDGEEKIINYPFAKIFLADSNKTQIGQTAIALGADNGLLLLLGVVSRLDTVAEESKIGNVGDVITVYTTINTDIHYSGGPLLNTDAEVIGINIVGLQNERFVIPANIIKILLNKSDGEIVSKENSERIITIEGDNGQIATVSEFIEE